MSDIGAMVAELISAGCAPEVAAKVIAEAFTAGVASAPVRVTSADESVTRRREKDRIRQQNRRDNLRMSADSADCHSTPLSSLKEDNRKRGARLSEDWGPSADERDFAKQLGWSEAQIDSEAANFRDYWIAKPGSGGSKLDWPATWRKWIRSSKVKPERPLAVVSTFERDWVSAARGWAAMRRWPRGHGPDPDSPACQCPPEILQKYLGAA